MKIFAKIVNDFQPLTLVAKLSSLVVCGGPRYAKCFSIHFTGNAIVFAVKILGAEIFKYFLLW